MEKIGIVEEIKDDHAIIRIQRVSACGESCGSCKGGCTPTNQKISIKNTLDVQIGERVKIDQKTDRVLKAAAIVYLVPLLSTFIGVIMGIAMSNALGYGNYAEGIGILSGMLFLVLTLLPIKWYDRRERRQRKDTIFMKDIIR